MRLLELKLRNWYHFLRDDERLKQERANAKRINVIEVMMMMMVMVVMILILTEEEEIETNVQEETSLMMLNYNEH